MNSAAPEPADLLPLLRQQVLLAQVRIMELEDLRDDLTPRLAETAALLADAQRLAETKADAAAHANATLATLLREFEHLRHTQHVTNEALTSARADLGRHEQHHAKLAAEIENTQRQLGDRTTAEERALARISELEKELARLRAEHTAQQARIATLDAEQRALKASRSWRWTAWLRSLERSSR